MFLIVALLLTALPAQAEEQPAPDRSGEWFNGAKGWLNTGEPLTREALKGQIVLIDFWTYCCINCMHVIPDLKYLEEKFKDQPFVVVGVHSGKFDQEKDAANIRAAVLRYGLTHPVAVDSDFTIWKHFGVHSWPTLALIDAHGHLLGLIPGEGHRKGLEDLITKLIAQGKADGSLAAQPLRFTPEHDADAVHEALSFPGKVLADAAGKRLFIADTGHHRIVVTDLDGTVISVIGSGKPGLADGLRATAQFNEPQGMALSADGGTLYVCDCLNHALRAVDVAQGMVSTLAGNGEQGQDRRYHGPALKAQLNSPWDVLREGNALFIAMAGCHQIWRYDLGSAEMSVHGGTGRESALDGDLAHSAFAQPSGLASDGHRLFVADSEASSIRAVDIEATGIVSTLAGSGDLFGFGLVDGLGSKARFQHPLGICRVGTGTDAFLVVADTYNQILRRVDALTGTVTVLAGSGTSHPGTTEHIGFFEPGGVSATSERLYVADTNHHRIVALDLPGLSAHVLPIRIPDSAAPAPR
jgi:sugar lactone lactonase YvrE/thiol-disulfide isomerase/thioredoxin